MQHFESSQLPKYNTRLSRDISSRQIFKICYGCSKGFCKRKGRGKAASIANKPGRFVCQKCADEMMNGKVNERLTILSQ